MEYLFQLEDRTIKISRYKVTYYQHYDSYVEGVEANESTLNERYFKTAEDAQGFIDRYLNKHKALEYVETIELDTSLYEWLDGIEIPSNYTCAQTFIDELVAMGEEEYNLSLTTTTEDYLFDLDYRLSLIELGLI